MRAEGWCGFALHERSRIECGYSSAMECESAVGKGCVCLVDPEFALGVKAAQPQMAAMTRRRQEGRQLPPNIGCNACAAVALRGVWHEA